MLYISFASVLLVILAHLLVGRMHWLEDVAHRGVGAGIAMSYVFLDVLPHLSSKQATLQARSGSNLSAYIEHHAYLLALVGLTVYLGLARVVDASREDPTVASDRGGPRASLHVLLLALALYCCLIGYLIADQSEHRYEPVIIFAVAMSVHFACVNHTVRERVGALYERFVRYLLTVATLAGWVVGAVTHVPSAVFAMVFSFVVGIILVLTFVYELPPIMRARRYWFFVAGVSGFSALLLLYEGFAKIALSA